MSTVTKEIMNLARKAGYEGKDKTNVTKAIDALADTLAGENLEQATNVAAAIRKLQPYVGGGGGDGEVTSYTLENYNQINIRIPDGTELQEDEVEDWIDERIENWINGQEDVSIGFEGPTNLIVHFFNFLFDKNKNVVTPDIGLSIVGGGILLSLSSVFAAVTFEKEEISEDVSMFHLSPKQNGYYQQLYAIRTERGDNDSLIPLEVVSKFDAEELIEDTVPMVIDAELGDLAPIPLVNYPSLNSPLSFDDFISFEVDGNKFDEPHIVLCQISIAFEAGSASEINP